MARPMSLQRKAPALMIAIGKGKPDTANEGPGGSENEDGPEEASDEEQQDPQDIAVCPSCGCTFNDETGKVLKESHPQHPSNAEGSLPGGPGEGGLSTGDEGDGKGGY